MRIPKVFIFMAIALIVMFYGYKALQFDQRVKMFNTRIQIGDSMAKVLTYMGSPTCLTAGYNVEKELADRYGLRDREALLLVYRGIFYFRDDLDLVFDPDTGRLIEKDRAFITWHYEE